MDVCISVITPLIGESVKNKQHGFAANFGWLMVIFSKREALSLC
jgi:hypothetical protein